MVQSKIWIFVMIVISYEFSMVSSDLSKVKPSMGEKNQEKLNDCYSYPEINQLNPSNEATNPGSMYDLIDKQMTSHHTSSRSTPVRISDEDDEDYVKPVINRPRPSKQVALAEKVSKGVFDLSQKLVTKVLIQSQNKFEVMSPVSISAALQLAFLGSNADTFLELMNALGYNNDSFKNNTYRAHEEFVKLLEDLVADEPNPLRAQPMWKLVAGDYLKQRKEYYSTDADILKSYHQISVANGIFVQQGEAISSDYMEAVKNVYKGDFQALNFKGDPAGAANSINSWVNEKTNGRIKEIIPGAANTETKVILANALYFKAEWEEMFIEGATSKKKFYPQGKQNGESIDVDMMAHGGKFPYYNDKDDCNCQIIGITYKKNLTTMYVILPNESSPERLREVQKCLTADKMNSLIEKMERKTAVVLFPKMHLNGGFSLKSYLQEIGISNLFNAQKSDLSLMSGNSQFSGRVEPIQSISADPDIFHFDNDKNPTTKSYSYNRNMYSTTPVPVKRNEYSNQGGYGRKKRDLSYKVGSENIRSDKSQLRLKDFVLNKRITKSNPGKKYRVKRQINQYQSLKNLDTRRNAPDLINPRWFADDVLHKVDLTINERGTEGGAATAITLTRSGTNVIFRADVPFMMLIRHDTTKLPLFYGVVFEPVNDV